MVKLVDTQAWGVCGHLSIPVQIRVAVDLDFYLSLRGFATNRALQWEIA
jgi:hypothetical protein